MVTDISITLRVEEEKAEKVYGEEGKTDQTDGVRKHTHTHTHII